MAPPTDQHKTRGRIRRAKQTASAVSGDSPNAESRSCDGATTNATKPASCLRSKTGDPEKRQALSVHALLKKVSASSSARPKDRWDSRRSHQKSCMNLQDSDRDTPPSQQGTSGVSSFRFAKTMCERSVSVDAEPSETQAAPRETLSGEVSLFMFDFEECDAKRCTGRRLLLHQQLNLIKADGSVAYAQRSFLSEARRISADPEELSNGEKELESADDSEREALSSEDSSSDAGSPYDTPQSLEASLESDAGKEEEEREEEEDEEEEDENEEKEQDGSNASLRRVVVRNGKFRGILLSPYGDDRTLILSPSDAPLMLARGLAVVDCSWKKVQEGRRARRINFVKGNARHLPLLQCANPTHYGAPNILTCAEALAAALFIAGFEHHATMVLKNFRWGAHFWVLNSDFFKKYIRAPNALAMRVLRENQRKSQTEELEERARRKREAATYEEALSIE